MKRTIALVFAAVFSLHAQVDSGSISGIVRDASGGAIPGVALSVQNEATGVELKLTTNNSGYYSAPALKPGS